MTAPDAARPPTSPAASRPVRRRRGSRSARASAFAVVAAVAIGGAGNAALTWAKAPAAPPPASRAGRGVGTLAEKLRRSGHAESRFERTVVDLAGGGTVTLAGRLALERPDRAAIAFPSTGERVTLRGDGGEWLQPGLQQMLRLGAESAAPFRMWWDAMAGRDRGAARRLGDGRVVLIPEGATDSAFVSLDAAGLPVRLEYADDSQRVSYRFFRWRFSPARGAAAFRIRAPAGYDVVELP